MNKELAVLFCVSCLAAEAAEQPAMKAVDERLTRSAAALKRFRAGAPPATQKLFDSALCVAVTARGEFFGNNSGVRGFVSCRPGLDAAWSNPAGIQLNGGGVYWPVVGQDADVVLLATNPSGARYLRAPQVLFSSEVEALPGPLGPEENPVGLGNPEIFAYRHSANSVAGLQLAGATMQEDEQANAALYGKRLSNQTILMRSEKTAAASAVERFLAALPVPTAGAAAREQAVAFLP